MNYFFSKPFETQIELAVVAFLVSVIDLEKSIFEKKYVKIASFCAKENACFLNRMETLGIAIEGNPELGEYGIPMNQREREREIERERVMHNHRIFYFKT